MLLCEPIRDVFRRLEAAINPHQAHDEKQRLNEDASTSAALDRAGENRRSRLALNRKSTPNLKLDLNSSPIDIDFEPLPQRRRSNAFSTPSPPTPPAPLGRP